ncbi:hypothetical protein ACS0TY_031057 [Phlomoides rotata]
MKQEEEETVDAGDENFDWKTVLLQILDEIDPDALINFINSFSTPPQQSIIDLLLNSTYIERAPTAAGNLPLKMTAVAAYAPKYNPEKPLGEDAFFISQRFQTIGVADGVGGWGKHGIDSGEYARQLMANSVLALGNETLDDGGVNPIRVLQRAFDATTADGSSTACIITLSGDKLVAANVGDSGFVVVRDGGVRYVSKRQQRGFNHPFQLGKTADDPSKADLMGVGVMSGDVVVAATDGLLDNMHVGQLVEIVGDQRVRDDDGLLRQAIYMAITALINSFDRNMDSPFSMEARKAGILYRGGKPDDITLVIVRID